jgi:hypothetical protein
MVDLRQRGGNAWCRKPQSVVTTVAWTLSRRDDMDPSIRWNVEYSAPRHTYGAQPSEVGVPGASIGHGTVSRKSLVDKGVLRLSKGVKVPVEESTHASLTVIWSKLSSSPMVFSDKNRPRSWPRPPSRLLGKHQHLKTEGRGRSSTSTAILRGRKWPLR